MKRENYISWDQYFMGVAKLSGMRSKDPDTQVGCCIVNQDKHIIGVGYNGFANGCSDDEFPWSKEQNGSILNSKYPYVVHAEVNAILNATIPVKGSTLYVTLFPCANCAKLAIQAGIKEIIYISDKNNGKEDDIAAKKMLKAAKVKTRCIKDFVISLENV